VSHHLDTPLARQNGQLYLDDLYVFQGNDSTVFVMDVNSNMTPGTPRAICSYVTASDWVPGAQSQWIQLCNLGDGSLVVSHDDGGRW
jgi:hypothetical protein